MNYCRMHSSLDDGMIYCRKLSLLESSKRAWLVLAYVCPLCIDSSWSPLTIRKGLTRKGSDDVWSVSFGPDVKCLVPPERQYAGIAKVGGIAPETPM